MLIALSLLAASMACHDSATGTSNLPLPPLSLRSRYSVSERSRATFREKSSQSGHETHGRHDHRSLTPTCTAAAGGITEHGTTRKYLR